MNPHTSSNADPGSGPVFHVQTRGVSVDLAVVGSDESPRDLGTLDRTRFEAVLAKLGALVVPSTSDADPYLTVKAHRGRFLVRPHRGRWLVEPAGSAEHDSVELASSEVADYLAGIESTASAVLDASSDLPTETSARTRAGLILLLTAVSALAFAGSVYFTFRPNPLDPDSAYAPPATGAQLEILKAQVAGRFTTAVDDGGRALEIRADGSLTWTEYIQDKSPPNERVERYVFALRNGKPVLRVPGLGGPISIESPNTLIYAHETYTRRQ
ncbi:MAG: hypothetical protein V4773_10110 [Verrucomicrobiota bacterium]